LAKWIAIAKNQYLLRTSSIRSFRPYFPFAVIILLGLYVLYLAPMMLSSLTPVFLSFFLSQAAVASVQSILLLIFLLFFLIPITYSLQQSQMMQLELLLSAPIKPKDMILGRFIGDMPLYAIGVTLVAGTFTAILTPLGLDAIQILIIIIIFVLTFFSGFWLGTLISEILRIRLSRTVRGKDIGKALALLIALPLVALMYALMAGGVFEAFNDPSGSEGIRTILAILPSSWGADVIIGFVNFPGNIQANLIETLTALAALAAFFLATLWLGTFVMRKMYAVEPGVFSTTRAKPEGAFYKSIKFFVGKGSFGMLVLSIFKDYGRRLENISKIVYVLGLLLLINIFFASTGDDAEEMSFIAIMQLIGIMPFLAVFIMGEVTIRGKENLFIFRKAPKGESKLIRARLVQGYLLIIPITVAVTLVLLLSFQGFEFDIALFYFVMIMLFIMAVTALSLGIFLIFPVFSEKPAEAMGNAIIIMMLSIFIFIFSIIVFGEIFGMTFTVAFFWLLGILFLWIGKIRLSKLE